MSKCDDEFAEIASDDAGALRGAARIRQLLFEPPNNSLAQSEQPDPDQELLNSTSRNDDEPRAFTLDSAYSQIGGFGRFQAIALLVFMIIRNFGLT